MEEFVEDFYSFDFAGDLVVNDEDEEKIVFESLDIENSNENDEEPVTIDDLITNKTKEVPVVFID